MMVQMRLGVPWSGYDKENDLEPSVPVCEGQHSPKNFRIRIKVNTIPELELIMYTNTVSLKNRQPV
jgi:hypothetical protein